MRAIHHYMHFSSLHYGWLSTLSSLLVHHEFFGVFLHEWSIRYYRWEQMYFTDLKATRCTRPKIGIQSHFSVKPWLFFYINILHGSRLSLWLFVILIGLEAPGGHPFSLTPHGDHGQMTQQDALRRAGNHTWISEQAREHHSLTELYPRNGVNQVGSEKFIFWQGCQ